MKLVALSLAEPNVQSSQDGQTTCKITRANDSCANHYDLVRPACQEWAVLYNLPSDLCKELSKHPGYIRNQRNAIAPP
jgi:hypothetical protein